MLGGSSLEREGEVNSMRDSLPIEPQISSCGLVVLHAFHQSIFPCVENKGVLT